MNNISQEKAIETIIKALDSKRAEDIQLIGIKDLTIVADYFVIANGTSKYSASVLASRVFPVPVGPSNNTLLLSSFIFGWQMRL